MECEGGRRRVARCPAPRKGHMQTAHAQLFFLIRLGRRVCGLRPFCVDCDCLRVRPESNRIKIASESDCLKNRAEQNNSPPPSLEGALDLFHELQFSPTLTNRIKNTQNTRRGSLVGLITRRRDPVTFPPPRKHKTGCWNGAAGGVYKS